MWNYAVVCFLRGHLLSMPGDFALDTAIRLEQKNPKQANSAAHVRYEKYKSARTVREFLALGGKQGDLAHDFKKGFIKKLNAAGGVLEDASTAADPVAAPAKRQAPAAIGAGGKC